MRILMCYFFSASLSPRRLPLLNHSAKNQLAELNFGLLWSKPSQAGTPMPVWGGWVGPDSDVGAGNVGWRVLRDVVITHTH